MPSPRGAAADSSAAQALETLAAELRADGSVISSAVADPIAEAPALGLLAAAGSRTRSKAAEYATVVEAVREGYLLHYGSPRLVVSGDRDLALLAGDYLYALGLRRLARLGDLGAVAELADLISGAAQLHAGEPPAVRAGEESAALWLAVAVAVAAGASPAHEQAKAALVAREPSATEALRSAARESAREAGIEHELAVAADAIDFALDPLSRLG